jgi:hypothetical protein
VREGLTDGGIARWSGSWRSAPFDGRGACAPAAVQQWRSPAGSGGCALTMTVDFSGVDRRVESGFGDIGRDQDPSTRRCGRTLQGAHTAGTKGSCKANASHV